MTEEGELSPDVEEDVDVERVSISDLTNLHVEIDVTSPARGQQDQEQEEEMTADSGIFDLNVNKVDEAPDDREVNVYLGDGISVNERRYENKQAREFVVGMDITSQEARLRREERAKRFGMAVEQGISGDDIATLLHTLGIPQGDVDTGDSPHRVDTIHVRGTEHMSTEDVFWYFRDYPALRLEWIDDSSCNVVWPDKVAAARAMLALTSPIIADSERKEENMVVQVEAGASVETEGEMNSDGGGTNGHVTHDSRKISTGAVDGKTDIVLVSMDDSSSVDLKNLPEGKWRLGVAHPKAKVLILRYALVTDCKVPGAEKRSEYYKTYGNPNYGGAPGIISRSMRRRIQSRRLRHDLEVISQQQTVKPNLTEEEDVDMTDVVGNIAKRRRIGPTTGEEIDRLSDSSDSNLSEAEDCDSNKPKLWDGLARGMRADEESRKQRKRAWSRRREIPIWQRISFSENTSRPITKSTSTGVDARHILNAKHLRPIPFHIERPRRHNVDDSYFNRDLYGIYEKQQEYGDSDDAQSSRAEKDSDSEVEEGELKESPSPLPLQSNDAQHIWQNVLRNQKEDDKLLEDDEPAPTGRELVNYSDITDFVYDSEPESDQALMRDLRQKLIDSKPVQMRSRSVETDNSLSSTNTEKSSKSPSSIGSDWDTEVVDSNKKHRSWRRLRSPTPPPDKQDLRHHLKKKKKKT